MDKIVKGALIGAFIGLMIENPKIALALLEGKKDDKKKTKNSTKVRTKRKVRRKRTK